VNIKRAWESNRENIRITTKGVKSNELPTHGNNKNIRDL
jgi:hypothetical protein